MPPARRLAVVATLLAGLVADGRTDIYALGCTLYRLLTGQAPYQGDDVALFRVAKGFVVQWGIHGDPTEAAFLVAERKLGHADEAKSTPAGKLGCERIG